MADLRDLARTLYEAAIAAADPARALARAWDKAPPDKATGRTVLIAFGKAAPQMMQAALARVEGAVDALAVTHHENEMDVSGSRVMRAGHPVPDAAGAEAAQEVMRRLDAAGPDDRVIALVSGGGSALLPAPVPPLTLADKQAVNEVLLAGGLDIVGTNLVRQQLSELKGGGFLRRAAPAPVTAYILSDVIGDDLRVVASGPTSEPIGTPEEARHLLAEAGLWDRLPQAAKDRLESATQKEPATPARNHLIGSNRVSLEAMEETTERAGFAARIVSDHLTGDVGDAAREVLTHLATPDRPTALLFGGETTVRLSGSGKGGRNQEMALRIALAAPDHDWPWVFLSAGTDGRDGPTDAAGGIVDGGTAERIRAAGGDAEALLADNDSYRALRLAGDLLQVPATGTNVADVQALLMVPGQQ
ncbi:hydroxypyruvate reductase [Roseivivax halodurans JCM 10272]|uniref:Hydroxypyruvate reductase n=1 Tax=Roseivivax halodurans JCM 10272 TaxID=1449350 RepID=X7EF60_9RHOB|nr:hydroxypyruvate reductase [Roseivivax halodurans JCM 10272]